jgi:hypothetical protein
MRSDQRKTVFVCPYRLQGHVPAQHAVALGAIRTELPAVNVGMAVGTLRAYIAEHRLRMALDALHFHVHATEGIAGLVVVELRNGADGLPTRLRVAILAGDG